MNLTIFQMFFWTPLLYKFGMGGYPLYWFFPRLRETSNVFKNVKFKGKWIFRIFSKQIPNGLWNTSIGKKLMSEGTPLLHFLVDRGRSLLITILFCLRVMTISEYFPNKFQMNYETPLSCNNKSFRGTPSAIGKLNCLRVLLLLTYFIFIFIQLFS